MYIWLTIKVGEYALKAGINPGIIFGCFSSAVVFNCILAYFIFGERVTLKMCLGMTVIVVGMLWISISKTSNY